MCVPPPSRRGDEKHISLERINVGYVSHGTSPPRKTRRMFLHQAQKKRHHLLAKRSCSLLYLEGLHSPHDHLSSAGKFFLPRAQRWPCLLQSLWPFSWVTSSLISRLKRPRRVGGERDTRPQGPFLLCLRTIGILLLSILARHRGF